MKKIDLVLFCTVLFLPVAVFSSCTSSAPVQEAAAASFSDVEGKDWFLAEIRRGGETVRLDREKLEEDGFNGIFTANFQEGGVSGMGAPNRFRGPYTAGSDGTLNIESPASTMMAAFREPDELKEHEYFAYLSSVTRWALREGRLELSGSDSDGNEVVLVFVGE